MKEISRPKKKITQPDKKPHPPVKAKLHTRNPHRERYDFQQLITTCPELAAFVTKNIYDDQTIDFSKPAAVLALNKALLKHHYGIDHWSIPEGYLCPPIPGRADYIHHASDLLGSKNFGKVPSGKEIRCIDIGVGANCVYPIIGHKEYGWSFVGTDIDPVAIASANKIIADNPTLRGNIEIRLQPNPKETFWGIVQADEYFDLTICNPPFHASPEEAQSGTLRKLKNLKKSKPQKVVLNFGGKNIELVCEGGEEQFVRNLIAQSKQFGDSCFWFSSLVAKETHLKSIYEALKKAQAIEVKTIKMGQGNKSTRVVAWTFLDKTQRADWAAQRWASK